MSLKDELLDKTTTRILNKTSKLLSEDEITEEQAGEVNKLAREEEWVEAAELLKQYKEQEQEDPLDEVFEEEEKHELAEKLRAYGIRRNTELTDQEKFVIWDALDLYLKLDELPFVNLEKKYLESGEEVNES